MGGSVTFCFFLQDPWGQTPEPIVTKNDLNNVDLDKDVHFEVKI